jgi:UDP-N-acetylglucosamine 1-carboxyvinyltransferase
MKNFIVQGKRKLSGTVSVNGSKNAVLPIMAATLLSKETSILHNVPDISDVRKMIEIFESLGAKISFENNTLTISPENISFQQLEDRLVCHMRSSLLLAGPLLARFNEVEMGYPGGCVLGKRPVDTHINGFKALGAQVIDMEERIHLKTEGLKPAKIVLPEFSVTGSENILIAAALTPGITELHIAAAEPHVADLCRFLNKMGANISGIGSHTLIIEGKSELHGAEHTVIADYLEAGTLILAGIVTKSEITVANFNTDDLLLFFEKLSEIGVKYDLTETSCTVYPSENLKAPTPIKTAVHPGFPTDLLSPMTILLTQVEGVSKIFETLFDGRFGYLYELEKMGVKLEILNSHQAIIIGNGPLKGRTVASFDIRAGAAMILAALCAEGETLVTDIKYIDRGYEKLDEKLNSLGADIQRVEI